MFLKLINKYSIYINSLVKKGLKKSLKEGNAIEKVLILFNLYPYLVKKNIIKQREIVENNYFFKKIKKENNIKNLKFNSMKNILYETLYGILFLFKVSLLFFVIVFTVFWFQPITGDITFKTIYNDFASSTPQQYFIGKTEASEKPLTYDLNTHILNPINSFKNLIIDDNKKTLEEFKVLYINEYKIKKEGKEYGNEIFEQFIGENFHYYHIEKEDRNALVILNKNLKTVHYNITYNNTDVYEDFSKAINKTEIHYLNESFINKITKEENTYSLMKFHISKYNYGLFDYFNPYKKVNKGLEIKKIELVDNTTNISYFDANLYKKDYNDSNYILGTDFQEKTNKFLFIFSLLVLLSFIEKKYLKNKINIIRKNNEKHIMNEYRRIKNINNNDILLLEDKTKDIKHGNVKKSKTFKAIQI
jgi:hypothetical protein